MEYIFLLLFFTSLICVVIGLIYPNFLRRYIRRSLTRKQNLILYGFATFISFIGIGIFAPDTDSIVSEPVTEEVVAKAPNQYSLNSDEVPMPVDNTLVESKSISDTNLYPVTRVIDGDTIEVLIGDEKKVVRYIGINTPETVHPSKPVECFGLEASNKNNELVAGKSVQLIKDVSETDTYGRLLRYVYVEETFVNLELVQGGYASASSYPPDVTFNDMFRQAEQEARTNSRGLWGEVCEADKNSVPIVPVTALTPAVSPETQTSGQCTIKGNINSDEEKIYHVIGCGSYNKTIIDESAGEKWFCTEEDALNAGWRKALNC